MVQSPWGACMWDLKWVSDPPIEYLSAAHTRLLIGDGAACASVSRPDRMLDAVGRATLFQCYQKFGTVDGPPYVWRRVINEALALINADRVIHQTLTIPQAKMIINHMQSRYVLECSSLVTVPPAYVFPRSSALVKDGHPSASRYPLQSLGEFPM